MVSNEAGRAVPPAGMCKRFCPEPSAQRSKPKKRSSCPASRKAAPAPSQNKTHVERSDQSINLENTSAPITNAFLVAPVLMNCAAISRL